MCVSCRSLGSRILLLSLTCVVVSTELKAQTRTFQHEHVLGTSLELKVWGLNSQQSVAFEQTVLTEIDRLRLIFSSHDDQSELMRWQRGNVAADSLSPELVQVLIRAEYWRVASQGAFDVRAGSLSKLWKQAEAQQQPPTAAALTALIRSFNHAPYTITQADVVRHDQHCISLDALAKGYILDAVCNKVAADYPEIKLVSNTPCGVSVMIGGDLRMIGTASQSMSIANPHDATLTSVPVTQVALNGSVALATSGGYRRFYEIDSQRYSHVIDARSGNPAAGLASVTVVAPTALDADAAATAANALGPIAGMQLIESLDGFACLMVLNSGEMVSSTSWKKYAPNARALRVKFINLLVAADEKEKSGLLVKFTLGKADGGRYRRPYVAVWLEDKDGYPVKTAVLWLQTDGPGPRWHRDLTRWYADDRLRKLVEEKELIGSISSATRGPGEYEARFDGTDNDGKALKPGKYVLCLEAAREHGSHQLIREELQWNGVAIAKKELKAGTEFSAVSYRLVPANAR